MNIELVLSEDKHEEQLSLVFIILENFKCTMLVFLGFRRRYVRLVDLIRMLN